jgi:hypothetical protein
LTEVSVPDIKISVAVIAVKISSATKQNKIAMPCSLVPDEDE